MANTYESIATNTLGSAAASVTFSSIPSTYTDLVLVHSNLSGTTQQTRTTFNSDTGANYSSTQLYGNGTTASSGRSTSDTKIDLGYLGASAVSTIIVQFMNYSNTTTYKTLISRSNNSANQVMAIVGLWRSTSAITSMTITAQTGTFDAGCTFNLYGIKAA